MPLSKKDFKKLKLRDPKTLEKFYHEYKTIIYNFLMLKTNGNKDATEEIFSDSIYSILKSVPNIKNDKNIKSWVLQITSRRLYDYINRNEKNKTIVEFSNDSAISEDNINEELINSEKMVMVQVALDSVKPNFKEVLKMKYIDNLPQKEIAVRLNKTELSVQSLLFRAREALKKELLKISKDF